MRDVTGGVAGPATSMAAHSIGGAAGRNTRGRAMPVLLVACASLAMLAGCASSAPLRFYTLSAASDAAAAPAAASASASEGASPVAAASGIRVGRVRLPAELDRSELVQRIDANRLRIADQDRWAAPLSDMIRRVLSANLQARAANAAGATLSVDIDDFIGDTTCAVTLRASWVLKGAGTDGASLATGREDIRVPPPSSAPCTLGALPAPMSQALAQLTDRIAARR